MENVKAFFAKMEGDKALQAKVGALNKKAKENLNEAIVDLVKIGSEAGFEFTADDYAEASTNKAQDAEVSGQELPSDCPYSWACTKVSNM